MSDRRELGSLGEDHAAAHFARLGFAVLARNARTRAGEIDLIVHDNEAIVFAEVKTRRGGCNSWRSAHALQQPLEGLRTAQRRRIRRAAAAWLADHAGGRPRPGVLRFDAVGIVVDRDGGLLQLEHLEGAW